MCFPPDQRPQQVLLDNRTISPIIACCFQYNQAMEKKAEKRKNAVGMQIRAARLAEKPPATQQEISARLATHGVYLSDSSIGKIENGSRPITDLQIIAFAKALKVSISSLFEQE